MTLMPPRPEQLDVLQPLLATGLSNIQLREEEDSLPKHPERRESSRVGNVLLNKSSILGVSPANTRSLQVKGQTGSAPEEEAAS